MTSPPDYARSRAILIGTARYQDRAFPQVPAAGNSLTAIHEVLVDPELCGWPADRVTVLRDPTEVSKLAQNLRRLGRDCDEVLLVYFVGHGVVLRRGQLCLVLSDTDAEDADITGLEFSRLRETLLDSPARVKIVILDCCYSGRAIEALAGEHLADVVDTVGVYTLAASDHAAHVVALDQQAGNATSFTAELVNLVREGVPESGEWLTLGWLYPRLRRRLDQRGLPTPNRRGTDTVDGFPFSRNAANRPMPPTSPAPPAPRRTSGVRARMTVAGALVAVVVLALAVLVITDPFGFGANGERSVEQAPEPGRIRVGVSDDPADFTFDTEIARLVARGLGFGEDEIDFVRVSLAERENKLSSDAVDYIVASYASTDARSESVSFSIPYYVARHDVMVLDASQITGAEDLTGKDICSVVGSTSSEVLDELRPDGDYHNVGKATLEECVELLRIDEVDAVAGEDPILRGYVARNLDKYNMVGQLFGAPLHYGVGLPAGDETRREAVNEILRTALEDGTWERIYDKTLRAAGEATGKPTLER
jgi:ABC-type amino acid transport substrate-binding protein